MGCGSGAGGSTSTGATTASPTAPGGSAEREAPKGASPLLREIYRQFPQPQPNPEVEGSARAIAAGEAACRGKTPLQVSEEFHAEAELSPDQAEMVAKLSSFERTASKSTDFVAGQLGALVYESTLPEADASYGYQGCVYSLARGLERELAPSRGASR